MVGRCKKTDPPDLVEGDVCAFRLGSPFRYAPEGPKVIGITEPGNPQADANTHPVAPRDFLPAATERRRAPEDAGRERDASILPHALQGVLLSPRADRRVPERPAPGPISFPSPSRSHRR